MEYLITVFTVWAVLISLLVTFGLATENGSNPSDSLQNPRLDLTIDQPKKRASTVQDYFQLESNVILVNKTGVLTLRLDCSAPYPIDLRFYGHITNQETSVKTFRKEHGTSRNSESWFFINATMETYEQITGNYTCASVENPKRFSSYYIYVCPTHPGVLLTRGQNITILAKADDTKIHFPCAVSHPDVHVQFYKDDEQVLASSQLKLVYDPKIGFTMDFDVNDNSQYGFYSCRTELSITDRVSFTFKKPRAFQVQPQISNIRISRSEQLQVSCNATEDFIIVTEPSSIPVDRNVVKRIGNGKNEPYYKYRGTYISSYLAPNSTGYISCKWKSSNLPFATWAFSVSNQDTGKPGELNVAKLITACPKLTDIVVFECSNPVECRINSCPRKDDGCQSNSHVCQKDKKCMQNGLLQCVTNTLSVMEIYFTGFSVPTSKLKSNATTRYVDRKFASKDELLLLKNVSNNMFGAGGAEYTCQGSNFVFSSGFKWVIYLTDGTQLDITSLKNLIGAEMNITVQSLWKERRSILESRLSIGMGSSSKNVSFIECHAPIWDSWEWMSQKIPVHIYSTKPVTPTSTTTPPTSPGVKSDRENGNASASSYLSKEMTILVSLFHLPLVMFLR